ncbi:lysophospholipid acyltransferase family protein [Microbacterium sp. GXS0129]|uniref:lysophospholipid acyltransferase family protein n=1 Tax=Microbacterium sp. GXS0129 TaxID=3377836 RepID=UPI00383A4A12
MSEAETPIPRPGAVYFVGRAVLRPLFTALYGARTSGREHVPPTGAVLLVANHLSGWDTVLIPTAASRPVQFLTKSSLFTRPGPLGRVLRWFFTSIGGVPVLRTAGQAAQAALDSGARILRAGSVFAVFPEGSRSRDGRLYQGRSGAGWMALETGATVVPVGVVGTADMALFGPLRGRPRPEVRFGAPLDLSDLEGMPRGAARRIATERIMAAIAALTSQERADEVNGSSRDAGA